jgi:hypothetical protein
MSDGHEVVGKHGRTDQYLKALTALRQTALHAAPAKEHRDATLNTCSETLAFLELGTLFEGFPLSAPFSTPLGNTEKLYILASWAMLSTEKPSVRAVPSWSKAKGLLMTLERRRDLEVIGGITLKDIVLSNQTSGTFSEKDLVAKLDWFLHFPPLDQIGVRFKNRVELLIGWNLLSLEHTAAALIDDAVAEMAVVLDAPSKLADDDVIQQVNRAFIFGFFEHPSGIVHDPLGNGDELAILVWLPGRALSGCQALNFLHPTARRASVVAKAIDAVGNKLGKPSHEACDHSHHIPEQSTIGGMMNIGFHNRRIDAQLLAVLQTQIDGRFKDHLIEGFKSLWPKFIKGPIESIVLGNAPAVKTREAAQGVTVGDALSEFAVIPVLDPHQNKRPKHLCRGDGRATGVGLFKTPLKILTDALDDLRLMVEELGNPLENGV